MDLTYVLRALLRRKWIILISVATALICAFVFTMNLKKGYKSIAQLSTGFTISETPNQGVNYLQSELKFNNAIENISSPKVISLVSYHLLLHDLQSHEPFTILSESEVKKNPIDRKTAMQILYSHIDSLSMLSSSIPSEKKVLSYLGLYKYNIENISSALKVERFQKSDYINIEYKSENPFLSAFVVNTLCSDFKKFSGSNERQRSSISIASLDSIVREKKTVLDLKQKAKEKFMAENGLLDANLEGQTKLSQISIFESQLIEEKGTLKNESYRVQQLDALIKTAKEKGITSISSPSNLISSNSNGEYIRLRNQYNTLYNEYVSKGSNDPVVKKQLDDLSLQMSRINIIEQENSSNENGGQNVVTLDDLVQKRIDAQAKVTSSTQKIAAIESKLNQLRSGITSMAGVSATVQQLDNEINIASSEYSTAKDQLNNALNFNETKSENFKQTLFGQPALKPEPSKRILIIFLSCFSAFFLSSFVIILKEFVDQSIKTPSQFQRLANLPLIGTLPKIKFDKQNVLEKISSFDEEEKHRNNTFLELLRKLRFEIESSTKKIFLFTSTEPQQGKTMLIQALSYILSLGKRKILIIDTNFCNNDLTATINAQPVLETFALNGKPFNKEDINKLVTHTQVEGVDIIGCKGGDYTPSEILPKNHLLNHLQEIKDSYDYIFLEGAPLNEFTDTKELLPYVDGMIAVFSAEKDLTPADKESIKFLEENKEKYIGAVLNKIDEDNLDL